MMKIIENAVRRILKQGKDGARAAALLAGAAKDLAAAVKEWRKSGKQADRMFLGLGPESAKRLFDLNLAARHKLAALADMAGIEHGLQDDPVILAYRMLRGGENAETVAAAAIRTLETRIALLEELAIQAGGGKAAKQKTTKKTTKKAKKTKKAAKTKKSKKAVKKKAAKKKTAKKTKKKTVKKQARKTKKAAKTKKSKKTSKTKKTKKAKKAVKKKVASRQAKKKKTAKKKAVRKGAKKSATRKRRR